MARGKKYQPEQAVNLLRQWAFGVVTRTDDVALDSELTSPQSTSED